MRIKNYFILLGVLLAVLIAGCSQQKELSAKYQSCHNDCSKSNTDCIYSYCKSNNLGEECESQCEKQFETCYTQCNKFKPDSLDIY